MNSQELYQKKLGTLKGALALLRPGDVLATACYGNEPSCFLGQLHTVAIPLPMTVLLPGMSIF